MLNKIGNIGANVCRILEEFIESKVSEWVDRSIYGSQIAFQIPPSGFDKMRLEIADQLARRQSNAMKGALLIVQVLEVVVSFKYRPANRFIRYKYVREDDFDSKSRDLGR